MDYSKLLLMSVRKADVFGVSWDGAESPTLTRTDSSIGMTANAGVDMEAVTNDFDGADIFKDITEVTDDLGNVFVRIPKFYIEKTAVGNARTWRISKRPFGNAYLPYCFRNKSGAILPYVDVGKYNAGLSSGSALTSASGVYPLISKNIDNFRNYAKANGANYHQLDIHIVDLLQTLFIIEFATLNSQSIMAGWINGRYSATDLAVLTETGVTRIALPNATAALYAVGQPISVGSTRGGNQVCYGRTITSIGVNDDAGSGNRYITFDGEPVNVSTGNFLYNVGWKSGFSSGILAKSGSIGSNSTGKFPCMYRGIENPFGNVYQFVDGININNNQAWTTKYTEDYASNLFASPYEQLSYISGSADGYVSQMGHDSNLQFLDLPIVASGEKLKYYSDYYYQATGQRVALVGGNWFLGSAAGLFSWDLSNASSGANVLLGGRLCRKAGG
jgi:hypothetical protein